MEEKTKPRMREKDQKGSWKQFWSFLRKVKLSWGWILLTFIVTIAYYAATSFIPGSTAALYAGDFTMAAIMGLVINYGSTLILSLISSIAQLMAESRSVRAARNSVWKRMLNIQASYYNENNPENLLSTITSDTEATVTSMISTIITIPSLFLYLIMCLAQVSMYNPKLLAVLFVLLPVYILYAVFMGRWQYKTGRSIQMRIGGLTGFLSGRIRNLNLIKSFATEEKEEQSGVSAARDLYKAKVQYQYISGTVVAYTMFTEAIGIVFAVIWGCMLLRQGEINMEAWLAFFLFVPMINTVLRQFSMMWTSIKEIQGRAARMGMLMDAPQEDMRAQGETDIPDKDISFQNVSFDYEKDQTVLKQVSFTIPAGKNTAIVGVSGSGKTTILKLIEQLYFPDEGSIAVGDTDLSDLNLASGRDRLSYVTQDVSVFSGSVRECLTYGIKQAVSDEALIRVTRLAGIYDYILEQGGFDSALAIWGSSLSGGQRQRLVIARELLKDSDIVLLDEPTSALDAETAAGISDTIFREFRGKTIVTVTHELNFIAGADQIIVLDKGRIVSQGTHRELMEQCPIYRELVEEQSYQEVFA